jgi:hypothetical protein
MGTECLDNLLESEFHKTFGIGERGESVLLPTDPSFTVQLKRTPLVEANEEQSAIRVADGVSDRLKDPVTG